MKALLQKSGEDPLWWDTNCQKWFVGYDLIPHPVGVGVYSELIDALFSTLCWVIEKNFLTK